MRRFGLILCVFLLVPMQISLAQTSSDTTTMADRTASENNSSSAIQERAPSTIVTAARARHTALRDARLSAQRSGDNSNLLQEESASSGASSSGLAGLLNGATGSLISTLLGGSGSTLITNSNSSSGSSSSSGNFSNLPSEVLAMLQSFGISLSDLQNAKSTQTAGETATKTSLTAQSSSTTTTTTTPFLTRWANAMLSTMFSSLTLAIQSSSFLELVKDAFRPLFGLDATDDSSSMLLPQPIELKRFRTGGSEGSYCYAFV